MSEAAECVTSHILAADEHAGGIELSAPDGTKAWHASPGSQAGEFSLL